MKQAEFILHLPHAPFCSDNPRNGLLKLPRSRAMELSHIQPNEPLMKKWLTFDLDGDDSYFAPEDRNCPDPHFITVNRANGHAHVGYLIENAVSWFEKSHREPIKLFRDVEMGLSRRMGADPSYRGFVCKNPFHKSWETHWKAILPYDLAKLADCLDKSDKKGSKRLVIGVGRNCSLFDSLRQDAYREVLSFKKEGRTEAEFRALMEQDGLRKNARFATPMYQQEVKGIAKSISKWVWQEFSLKRFSEIQKARAEARWAKVSTAEAVKPWAIAGVSRRTWYRQRKAGTTHLILS
jgi:hypothetical protein